MKRLLTIITLAVAVTALNAQTPKDVKYSFTEASELNLIGKIIKDTPNPVSYTHLTLPTMAVV